MKHVINIIAFVLISLTFYGCLNQIYDSPKGTKKVDNTVNTPTNPVQPTEQTLSSSEPSTWVGCTVETPGFSEIQINATDGELDVTSLDKRTEMNMETISVDRIFKISANVSRYVNAENITLKGTIKLTDANGRLLTSTRGYSFYSKNIRLSESFTGLLVYLEAKITMWTKKDLYLLTTPLEAIANDTLGKQSLFIQLKCNKICTTETCRTVLEDSK